MQSTISTINKCHTQIKQRIQWLENKKKGLREYINEKYPADIYGVKGMTIYDEKSKKIEDELRLLKKYDYGFYDLVEAIEFPKGR